MGGVFGIKMPGPSDVSGASDESGHSLVPSSNEGLNFGLALTYSLQEVNQLLRTYFIFFSFRYDKKVNYLITMTQKVYKLYERNHSTCRCRGWILRKVDSPTKIMMSKKVPNSSTRQRKYNQVSCLQFPCQ